MAPNARADSSCNVGRGAELFESKCAVCHTSRRSDPDKAGPNLFGVVGRPAASRPAFAYSAAMKKFGEPWLDASLDRFLAGPQAMVPGTFMAFTGVRRAEDRRAIVCFLSDLGP